jgi:hypothetical protein
MHTSRKATEQHWVLGDDGQLPPQTLSLPSPPSHLMVPLNSTGSWGMMANCRLRPSPPSHLMVPLNSTGSWGMMANCRLRPSPSPPLPLT